MANRVPARNTSSLGGGLSRRRGARARRVEDATGVLLRAAIECLDENFLLCDSSDRVVLYNRRFAENVGGVVAVGQRFEDMLRAILALGRFPDAIGREDAWIAARLAARRDGGADFEVMAGERWFLVRDHRTPDGATITVGIDISNRKRAELQARAAEERLRGALEHLGEMICLTDADDRIVLANQRFVEFNARVAEHTAPGRFYSEHLRAGIGLGQFPDAIGREQEWLAERLAVRRSRVGPVERRRQDGRWLMVDDQVLPDGGIISYGIEITARKCAEEALAASEARLRSLVNLSNDIFWETDADHRFVAQEYSNRSAISPAQSEIGRTRWEVPYTVPDADGWQRHRAQLEAHEVFRDFELARPLPGGGERHVQVSGEPLFDAEGAFRGYRGVARDISARKRAEQALRQLNVELESRVAERTIALETAYRELESFSYSVSHDLRAPLRAIAGFSSILKDDEGGKLSAQGRRHLDKIAESAGRMGRLTDALLSLARTSRQKLSHGTLDMTAIATRVIESLAPDYPQARFDLRSLPAAAGDETLVTQIFANLIGNALKYAVRADPPVIEIGARRDGTDHVYYVRDNGVGFDMTYVEKLFRPFARLHSESEFKGAGIGLALTRLIVERHGGRIWAEGAEGSGAVFRWTLSGMRADQGRPGRPEQDHPSGGAVGG